MCRRCYETSRVDDVVKHATYSLGNFSKKDFQHIECLLKVVIEVFAVLKFTCLFKV